MATTTTRDPVQGLVDYVLDVKPFHTKILEVWVEYIYNDPINGKINDKIEFEIHLDFERLTPCKYGWDTSPWDIFWNKNFATDPELEGNFTYLDTLSTVGSPRKRIAKFDAYRLFFDFLTAKWKATQGEVLEPIYGDISLANPFRVLFLDNVSTNAPLIEDCSKYWNDSVNTEQYWYEPTFRKLYSHSGTVWSEMPFFYSAVPPTGAVLGDFWFDTNTSKLYSRSAQVQSTMWEELWIEVRKFVVSTHVPGVSPTYPEQWRSNWDYPPCEGPYGENHIYARISDILSFEHGSEIFLFDRIFTTITDPNGKQVSLDDYIERSRNVGLPVLYRTTINQPAPNQYTMDRVEISALTDPDNPLFINSAWNIDMYNRDIQGWHAYKSRKDVRLVQYSWTRDSLTGKAVLFNESLVNTQVFMLGNLEGDLIVQRTDDPAAIELPWVDGSVIYVRSTDDLPAYIDPISGNSTQLGRYTPYRIVHLQDNKFSLVIVDVNTLEIDEAAMAGQTSLVFSNFGTGRQYAGIGYPVPFMEIQDSLTEMVNVKKVREVLASASEVFLGHEVSEILDIALSYQGEDGSPITGFVVEGNYSNYKADSEIQVGGSYHKENDGIWTIDRTEVYSNQFPSFDPMGVPTPSTPPSWWNVSVAGTWPQPVKKSPAEIDAMVANGSYVGYISEYSYRYFSIIGVKDGIPQLTQKPFGFVAEPSYNFNEGSGKNAANATVADKLIFGSLRAILNPDGTTTFVTEPGVPGVSMVFTDRIKAIIEEKLNRNDPYGGLTPGSYDATFYDQDTYDENLDTIIRRMQSQ